MGHRSIQSTVRYAALASGRFKNIWQVEWSTPCPMGHVGAAASRVRGARAEICGLFDIIEARRLGRGCPWEG